MGQGYATMVEQVQYSRGGFRFTSGVVKEGGYHDTTILEVLRAENKALNNGNALGTEGKFCSQKYSG